MPKIGEVKFRTFVEIVETTPLHPGAVGGFLAGQRAIRAVRPGLPRPELRLPVHHSPRHVLHVHLEPLPPPPLRYPPQPRPSRSHSRPTQSRIIIRFRNDSKFCELPHPASYSYLYFSITSTPPGAALSWFVSSPSSSLSSSHSFPPRLELFRPISAPDLLTISFF